MGREYSWGCQDAGSFLYRTGASLRRGEGGRAVVTDSRIVELETSKGGMSCLRDL